MANQFPNPGFEVDTTGWSSSGTSVFERTTSEFHSGAASLHVTFDGATAFPSVASGGIASGFPASGVAYATGSIWFKGTGSFTLRALWYTNGFGNTRVTSIPVTLAASWTEVAFAVQSLPGDTNDAFQITMLDLAGVNSSDFYVDDAYVDFDPPSFTPYHANRFNQGQRRNDGAIRMGSSR